MKKIITWIASILFIIIFYYFFNEWHNRKYFVNNKYIENEYISIIINDNIDNVNSVLNILSDFEDYFSNVYVDSLLSYKINNSFKLANKEDLNFLFQLYNSKDIMELLDFIANSESINDNQLMIKNNIINT